MWSKKFGKYKKIKELGKGGYGEVYLVEHEENQYALKFLAQGRFESDISKRFILEALRINEMRDKFDIEFLAQIIDADLDHLYFVMEYLPDSAEDYFYRTRDEDFIARFIHCICQLHEANVVHRDLKPANIRVKNNKPIVIDFGFASWWDSYSTITPLGTRVYSPPEIICAFPEYYGLNAAGEAFKQILEIEPDNKHERIKQIKKLHDVYSLGMTIGELFNRKLPFVLNRDKNEYKQYLDRGSHSFLDRWLAGIPGTYRDFVKEALTFFPKDRPQLAELIKIHRVKNPGIESHIPVSEDLTVKIEGKYECVDCNILVDPPANFCPQCGKPYRVFVLHPVTPSSFKTGELPGAVGIKNMDKVDSNRMSILVDMEGNDFNMVLGRKENTIPSGIIFPGDPFMSNPHGRLIKKGKCIYYMDDKNGTLPKNPGSVNNMPVGRTETELLSGDCMLLGSTVLFARKYFGEP